MLYFRNIHTGSLLEERAYKEMIIGEHREMWEKQTNGADKFESFEDFHHFLDNGFSNANFESIPLICEPLKLVFTTREAESLWDMATNTVNTWCNRERFLEDEARRSSGTWIVSAKGMIRLTDRIPAALIEKDNYHN
ncbi:helix-turn-helix domain-containing protein [Priestia koreensis]|uniref:helix-turn-helix domain-containing protein n=1 Tax=Priestia koreensis TaxID=284581 RepID=UPI003CFED1BB